MPFRIACRVTSATVLAMALIVSAARAAAPAAQLNPGAVAFAGTQATGTVSAPQVVTLSNTGNAPLGLSGITVAAPDPADFLVDAASCAFAAPLAPGASCQILVRFVPQARGDRTASLQLFDTASDSPQTVALSGRGGGIPRALAVVIASGGYRARAGASLAVRYAASRKSAVTVQILKGSRVVMRAKVIARPGHNALKLTHLPRTGGRYTVKVTARSGQQTTSDQVGLTIVGAPKPKAPARRHTAPDQGPPAVGGGGTS
jgi:hypothetical protein